MYSFSIVVDYCVEKAAKFRWEPSPGASVGDVEIDCPDAGKMGCLGRVGISTWYKKYVETYGYFEEPGGS